MLMRKHRHSGIAVLILIGFYVLGYYALVEARPLSFMSGIGPWPRRPHYRFGGMVSTILFAPMQSLDSWLRPEYWEYRIDDWE